jgi:hypothetical protein
VNSEFWRAQKAIGKYLRERILPRQRPLARAREEIEAWAKEVKELEQQAGVQVRVEYAVSTPSLVEKIRIREAYFSISDQALRTKLIAADRKLGSLLRQGAHLEEAEANRAQRSARASGEVWWILASVQGILWVAAGAYVFGTSGAVGGAVVAFFCGRHYEEKFKQAQQRAIESAQLWAKQAQANSLSLQREPPTFSSEEEKTGTPDPETTRQESPWAEGLVANLAEALGVPGAAVVESSENNTG